MANQLFAGFLYTAAGAAVNGATVDLFDRNTTTPVRATTTTNTSGYWAISHVTEGRFDVRITNGTSISFIKYDDSFQVETIETAVLRVRNPADTFDYDIVPAAITADRQLNLPLIAATDTLMTLGLAATVTGAKTFNSSALLLFNPAGTFAYTFAGAAITAARTLTVPLLTGDDTLVVLTLAQTFLTGVKTFNSSILGIRNPADTFSYTVVSSAITADRQLALPLITANDTLVVLAEAQTLTNKTLTSPVVNTQLTGTAVGTGASQVAQGSHTTPAMTATVAGHVPTPPNNTTTFLRGDGTFAAPVLAAHGAADHTGDVIPAANQDFGAFYSDIAQIAAPANPGAGTRRLFVDSADGKLKVRTSAGASTSLEEAGGAGGTDISVRAISSADTSLTTGTWTNLAMAGADRFDTDTMHDPVTNNSRITFNTAGKYIVTAHAAFLTNATGVRKIGIALNAAATYIAMTSTPALGAGETELSIATVYSFIVGDFINLQGYQTSGGALSVRGVGGENYSVEFAAAKVLG